MKILIACEHSGTVRNAFASRGHDAWSCDLLPSTRPGNHLQCDVLSVLDHGWDLMVAHPDCTYLTVSASWAYADPDLKRYPGVGYHQKTKPETLVGAPRREAREKAIAFVCRLWESGIKHIAIENPIGVLGTRFQKATQIIQPHQFGHNASKGTCLWLKNLPCLAPTLNIAPRMVAGLPRWDNQTDSGQNRESPAEDRWAVRSLTYRGIADAMADQWRQCPLCLGKGFIREGTEMYPRGIERDCWVCNGTGIE